MLLHCSEQAVISCSARIMYVIDHSHDYSKIIEQLGILCMALVSLYDSSFLSVVDGKSVGVGGKQCCGL